MSLTPAEAKECRDARAALEQAYEDARRLRPRIIELEHRCQHDYEVIDSTDDGMPWGEHEEWDRAYGILAWLKVRCRLCHKIAADWVKDESVTSVQANESSAYLAMDADERAALHQHAWRWFVRTVKKGGHRFGFGRSEG